MSAKPSPVPSLRELELEVEAEGREWMRRRLEEELQVQADRHGGVSPPERTPGAPPAAAADASAHGLRRGRPGRVARPKSR